MEFGHSHKIYPVINEQPCSTAFASGVFAGTFLGGTYGLYFGTLELLTTPTIDKALIKDIGKHTLIAAGGMACMLAIYNGAECTAKHVRGRRDFLNSAIGGFFAGGIYGIFMNRALQGGLKTAVAGSLLGSLIGLFHSDPT
eukprot:Phypoly_transcript_21659.p1 GENE.Phypoly_transcript_21659~~Phypoly_transcript_21659.p1  ORF type:complete len:141 (+),score=13.85 Phypoly_transcript_21659:57-479(+)